MLCLGVFFEGRVILIVFFVMNKEIKRGHPNGNVCEINEAF
jgi:hypothetical protein